MKPLRFKIVLIQRGGSAGSLGNSNKEGGGKAILSDRGGTVLVS